ncbi:prolyl oligopeptidase family serine peptidase [Clostridium neuense]|uniref:Prolyl oligopeptidase family serine peptidase n=1 Tax=Clostridium neuense TaxID=1728934 RepID=A0ABW8TEZ4_9CLOT
MDLAYLVYKNNKNIFKTIMAREHDELICKTENVIVKKKFTMNYNCFSNSYVLYFSNMKISMHIHNKNKLILTSNENDEKEILEFNNQVVIGGIENIVLLLSILVNKFKNKINKFSVYNIFSMQTSDVVVENECKFKFNNIGVCKVIYVNMTFMGFNIVLNSDDEIIYAIDPFNGYEIVNNKCSAKRIKKAIIGVFSKREDKIIEETLDFKDIMGSLTKPKDFSSEKTYTGVLILSGSGSLDRDGNSGDLIWNNMKDIAWFLSEKGLITYRYDDKICSNIGISDLYNDAEIAYKMLKGLDFLKDIFIVAHSQGCLLASMLAKKFSEISEIILMAPQGKETEEFLMEQYRTFSLHKDKTEFEIKEFYYMLRNNNIYNTKNKYYIKYKNNLKRYQELINLEVCNLYRSVKCSVLLLHGEDDYQITLDHTLNLEKIIKENGVNVKRKTYENLDHFFMKSSLKYYGDYGNYSRVISKGVLYDILNDINMHEGGR